MISLKSKRLLGLIGMALLGAGYLGAFSAVDAHPILKYHLALLPIQVSILIYLLWWKQREASHGE